MKEVSVIYTGQPNAKGPTRGLLIESMKDIADIKERIYKAANGTAEKFVKSGMQPDRYDHAISGEFTPIEKALGSVACLTAYFAGRNDNPLFHLGGARDMYFNGIIEWLSKGNGPIFIGRNGGYCPANGTVEIVETHKLTKP